MSENLKLWESVSTTDASATKRVNQRGGYTSICATYQAMVATEQFGSYGRGWGLESIDYDYSQLETLKMVLIKAVFFYVIEGNKYSFPISNAIQPFVGTKMDEDFCKKVETNTISKALSRLGFNADVFMGLFDDMDYVSQIKAAQDIEKANDRDEEIQKKRDEAIEYVKTHLDLIANSSNISEVKGIQKASLRHLTNHQKISVIADICERGIKSIAIQSESKIKLLGETK